MSDQATSSAEREPFLYFLPSGGTPQCHDNGNGTTTIYYGGWASPYTDSYATDPLFTTSISQGMVDRRSPGSRSKFLRTAFMDQKQIRFISSQAYYDYGNATGGVAPTQEFNLDGTYFSIMFRQKARTKGSRSATATPIAPRVF